METISGIEWDFYKISTLIAAFGAFLLGVISISRDRKNLINITISVFNFMVMFLLIALVVLRTVKTVDAANMANGFLSPAMLMLPLVLFRFSVLFTKAENKWSDILYKYLVFSTAVMIIMTLFNVGVKSLYYKSDGGYYIAQPDFVYAVFSFNVLSGVAGSVYILIKKYLSPDVLSIEKKQLQYLLMAFIILALTGATNILDIFGIKIPPLVGFGGLVYVIIMTYAALTYDLLQIKELLAKILAFAFLALGFSVMGIMLLLVLNSIKDFNLQLMVGLPAGALIIITVNWLGRAANKLTGRIFLNSADFDFVINIMQEKTMPIMNAGEIAAAISGIASETLKVDNLNFILKREKDYVFHDDKRNVRLPYDSPLINLLSRRKAAVYFEELNNRLYYSVSEEHEKSEIRGMLKVFRDMGAEICLPLFIGDGIVGAWFVGAKRNNNIFSREEMRFLKNVIYLLSTRMENILLYERLMGTERLVMMGRMAAAVAHEIRNPLTGLGSFIQMINEGQGAKDKILDRFLKIAPAEFKRLERLTDNLLALGRYKRMNLMPVDINVLVNECWELLSHLLKKNRVEVETFFDCNIHCMADREQLGQVIMNLMVNAVQAMPSGGKITFRTGCGNTKEDRHVFLVIEDTGAGMPYEIKNSIFEPFFTTKAEGTGLGLAICRNIMQSHGGSIEVDSEEGKGSVFTLHIPAAE